MVSKFEHHPVMREEKWLVDLSHAAVRPIKSLIANHRRHRPTGYETCVRVFGSSWVSSASQLNETSRKRAVFARASYGRTWVMAD